MREYVYIWNNSAKNYIIASGIEFKDMANLQKDSNYILLAHESNHHQFDAKSGFDYILSPQVPKLLKENIYNFGDFCWADFTGDKIPVMPKNAIAELLYFRHAKEPLRQICVKKLFNSYLVYAHDDGWYLKLYYDKLKSIEKLLEAINKKFKCALDMADFASDKRAYWIEKGKIEAEEISENIDMILNKRL